VLGSRFRVKRQLDLADVGDDDGPAMLEALHRCAAIRGFGNGPDGHSADGDPLRGQLPGIGRKRGNFFHNRHAAGDLSEDRVLAVELQLVGDADEELAAGAVGVAGDQDGSQCAPLAGAVVELGLELAQAPCSVAIPGGWIAGQRIAGLDDAVRDDPEERQSVKKTLVGQFQKMGHVLGRVIREEADDNGTEIRLQHGFDPGRVRRHRRSGGGLRGEYGSQGDDSGQVAGQAAHGGLLIMGWCSPPSARTDRPQPAHRAGGPAKHAFPGSAGWTARAPRTPRPPGGPSRGRPCR